MTEREQHTHTLNSQNEWKNIPYYFSYSILTVKFCVTDFLLSRSFYVFISFLFFFFCCRCCCYCCYIYFCSVWCCCFVCLCVFSGRHMYGIFRIVFFCFTFSSTLDIVVSLLLFRVNCQENNIIFHTRYVTCTCLYIYIYTYCECVFGA